MPALLTTTASRPCPFTIVPGSCARAALSVTSTSTASARPPCSVIAAAVAAAFPAPPAAPTGGQARLARLGRAALFGDRRGRCGGVPGPAGGDDGRSLRGELERNRAP